MKKESHNSGIEPELEARIVALVLGEASDFERDHLNRLIEQRPELAKVKERIESVHELMLDVGAGEQVVEDDDWKLPAEKRSSVMAVISGEENEQSAIPSVNKLAIERSPIQRSFLRNFGKVAAIFCVVGFFGLTAISAFFSNSVRTGRQLARTEKPQPNFMDASSSFFRESSTRSRRNSGGDGAETITVIEGVSPEEQAFVTEFDVTKGSKSSLLAIRESLGAVAAQPSPYYLMDDVQYFPALPENKLALQAEAMRDVSENEERAAGLAEAISGSESAESTMSVPDSGAILLGGIRRFGDGQSESAASGEQSEWLRADRFEATKTDSEMQNAADTPRAESGLDWQKLQAKSGSSPDDGVLGLGFQERAQEPESSQGIPSPRDDTTLRFSIDSADLPADRHGRERDALNENGDGVADGRSGFGRNGSMAADTFRQDSSSERKSEEIEPLYFGSAFEIDGQIESAAAQPTVAGSSLRDEALGKEAGDAPVIHLFSMDIPSTSEPSPTTKPMDSPEDLKQLGDLAESIADKDGFARERVTHQSDDLALLDKRTLGAKVTGDPIQQLGELTAENARQDAGWYYQSPATKLQGQTSTAGDLYGAASANENDKDGNEELASLLPSSGLDAIALRQGRWGVPAILKDTSESKKIAPSQKLASPAGLNENKAEDEAFSTFSLNVSDVSFKLARAALALGEWPEPGKVRIEEFVNALDYGDPLPSQSEKVACQVEQCIHPFLQQRNLLRVSMRTAASGRSSNTPLRLTFLLDNSGSMERIDRQQTVRRAFALLTQQLEPLDQVTLISFARQPRLLADKVSGARSQQLVDLIDELPSEGGTNIEAALQLAFEKAREQQADGAQNRIILLTDGAVNLGDANPENLSRMITTMRDAGIAFDAAGISAEGLNDEILEALTRKGDGRYYLLDSLEAADDGFARQIAGALRPSAKNVKVQVEFNPKRVGRYKLLGFEKHLLKQEDFRDDNVDAAEMAAAEAGVAIYQFEAKPEGEGDVGSVSVRFRDLSTGQMIENRWPIPYEADAPRPNQATPSLRIAISAALLAAKLRGEPLGETVDLKSLYDMISGLPDRDRDAKRVQQLQLMIEQARQVSGN